MAARLNDYLVITIFLPCLNYIVIKGVYSMSDYGGGQLLPIQEEAVGSIIGRILCNNAGGRAKRPSVLPR